METRYKLMSEAGVRNITGYNEYVEELEEEYEEQILEAEGNALTKTNTPNRT